MRYRVLVYAGLAFVLSRPAEAQKLQIALAAAADFTPVYPFGKIPTNIKGIVAIAELGKEKPTCDVSAGCTHPRSMVASTPRRTCSPEKSSSGGCQLVVAQRRLFHGVAGLQWRQLAQDGVQFARPTYASPRTKTGHSTWRPPVA